MKKFAIIFSLLATVTLLTVGCDSQKLPPGMPDLYPTTLTFTCDGQPLDDAVITLVPQDGPAKGQWVIGGRTDASGVLNVKTHGQYDGAPEGKMVVCVDKQRIVPGPISQTERPTDDIGAMQDYDRKVREEQEIYLVAGQELKDPATSTLEITITPGKNRKEFEVPKVDERIQ